MMGSMEFRGFLEDISGNSPTRSGSSALVLDSEKGALVTAPVKLKKDGMPKEKAVMALRNHSEAERRRRARINGHLGTLKALIPGTSKMDKASLLEKVISHLKELRKDAVEATTGLIIPFDTDEVRVEESIEPSGRSPLYIKVSLCCDYGHEVLSDLRKALDALRLKTIKAEIATLGDRMKTIFVMTGNGKEDTEDSDVPKCCSDSVQESLSSVLDRYSASKELTSTESLSNKRRRISCVDYSSACSSTAFW